MFFHRRFNGLSLLWSLLPKNPTLPSDSTSALLAFKNSTLVPVLLCNRWHNACRLGVQVISSHIYRAGNFCADRLANMGHAVHGVVWLSALPPE